MTDITYYFRLRQKKKSVIFIKVRLIFLLVRNDGMLFGEISLTQIQLVFDIMKEKQWKQRSSALFNPTVRRENATHTGMIYSWQLIHLHTALFHSAAALQTGIVRRNPSEAMRTIVIFH